MDDDLNTADALASLFDLVRDINILSKDSSKETLVKTAEIFDNMSNVLGLLYNRATDEVPAEVQALAEQRQAARAAKDWALADELRAKLDRMGYVVEDTKEGPKIAAKA